MSFKIYLNDLNPEWIERIREVLRHDLAYEIEAVVATGVDPKMAEAEIIDDYLNRNNMGWTIYL
jgi:hypothetical protein